MLNYILEDSFVNTVEIEEPKIQQSKLLAAGAHHPKKLQKWVKKNSIKSWDQTNKNLARRNTFFSAGTGRGSAPPEVQPVVVEPVTAQTHTIMGLLEEQEMKLEVWSEKLLTQKIKVMWWELETEKHPIKHDTSLDWRLRR